MKTSTIIITVIGIITVIFLAFAGLAGISYNFFTNNIGTNTKIVSKSLTVNSFDKIEFDYYGSVKIKKGNESKVEIEDYENKIDKLDVQTKNGILTIRTSLRHVNFGNSRASFVITTPAELSELTIRGGGNIIFADNFDSLKSVNLFGAGDIESQKPGAYDKLSTNIAGAGKIKLDGTANSVDANIEGVGSLELGKLKAQNVNVSISGAGSAVVDVIQSLNAKVSGTGSILYSGDPVVTRDISGLGSIKKK